MSRRDNEPSITVISWRDIPAQVVAKHGDRIAKSEMPQRFQVAIDRAAMYAGLFETDDYLTEWRRATRPCSEDVDLAVTAEVDKLEHEFTSEALNSLANNGGFFETASTEDQEAGA